MTEASESLVDIPKPRIRSYMRDVFCPMMNMEYVHKDVQWHQSTPFLFVQYPKKHHPDHPTILLSAGIHGSEPAGVYAAMDWLQDSALKYADQCNFTVLPCINPSGYELNTRFSENNIDLNRQFNRRSREPEIRIIEDWLEKQHTRFAFTMDLHENPPDEKGEGYTEKDNPHGCYLYETMCDTRKRIGKKLIAALPPSIEACGWPSIFGEKSDGGVITYPEACRHPQYAEDTTFEGYLNGINVNPRRFTDHSFTTETPTIWNMEKRIQTHTIWIQTAIELLLKQR